MNHKCGLFVVEVTCSLLSEEDFYVPMYLAFSRESWPPLNVSESVMVFGQSFIMLNSVNLMS